MDKEASTQPTTSKLLNPEERQACERISTGEPPWSQRAQALLALDAGATQAEAGGPAGLTSGQVKYWLGKFRQSRMDIFPVEVVAIVVIDPALPKSDTAKFETPPAESSQEVEEAKETEKPEEVAVKEAKMKPAKKSKVDKDTPKKKKSKSKKSKGQEKKKAKKKKKSKKKKGSKKSKKDKSTKNRPNKKSKKNNKN